MGSATHIQIPTHDRYLDAWHPGVLVNGEPGAQGTQMDAFGHWGTLNSPWDGDSEFPASDVTYYGGFKQKDVKPQPDAPLAKLGIDKVPPKKVTSNSLVQREMTLKRKLDSNVK